MVILFLCILIPVYVKLPGTKELPILTPLLKSFSYIIQFYFVVCSVYYSYIIILINIVQLCSHSMRTGVDYKISFTSDKVNSWNRHKGNNTISHTYKVKFCVQLFIDLFISSEATDIHCNSKHRTTSF